MRRRPVFTRAAPALAVLALLAGTVAIGQSGPPAHERRAVEAIVALIDGDEASIDAFIDTAMAPAGDRDRGALTERLREIRAALRGPRDGIAVEAEPDGVRLIVDRPGGSRQLRVTVGPEGIAALRLVSPGSDGAGGRDDAIRDHVRALERSFVGDLDDVVAGFESERFSPAYLAATDPAERRRTLEAVREAARGAGDVLLEPARDGVALILGAPSSAVRVEIGVEPDPPYRIDALRVSEERPSAAGPRLTRENLAATFDRLEAEGWSGVASVRLDGELVLERAFGVANEELGTRVSLDTVFGTGSRPIDYTRAAIELLEQRGRIDLDHTIDRYLDDVPVDKRSITIRHLMTGRSGLPDFFHTADDRDPDLAWVDRDEFVRRVLSATLLFPPGSDSRHSHGAFGLLAALVERVGGESYYAFIRRNFLDPAGMGRTGEYGEARGLRVADFAVGGGPSRVGVPNIPPNWGPTSWLVKGSGGMYSTLPDLKRFYDLIRSGTVLDERHARLFAGEFVQVDGSDRGFELFHVHAPPGNEAYLMVNMPGHRDDVRGMFRALVGLVRGERDAAEGP